MYSGQNQWEEATEWINTFRGREKGVIIIITPERDRMSGGHGRLFFLPSNSGCLHCSIIVCFWERAGEENAMLFAFQGAGGMQSCVTGYSMYGRFFFFFHSLRYTLINLLKAATPVSSSLTHLKRQTALNPTRIFSMDANEKNRKICPALQLTAFCHRV